MNTVEQQLRKLEEQLIDSEFRRSSEAVSSLLADEFREFGSSGRAFNKQQIIDALQTESAARVAITDFRTKVLAENVVLVTYQATRQGTTSLRSSIWIMRDARWQILFHQGTTAP